MARLFSLIWAIYLGKTLRLYPTALKMLKLGPKFCQIQNVPQEIAKSFKTSPNLVTLDQHTSMTCDDRSG